MRYSKAEILLAYRLKLQQEEVNFTEAPVEFLIARDPRSRVVVPGLQLLMVWWK